MLRTLIAFLAFMLPISFAQDKVYSMEELAEIGRQEAKNGLSTAEANGGTSTKNMEFKMPEQTPSEPLPSLFEAGKNLPKMNSESLKENPQIFVFVSLSMSDQEMAQILRDAKVFNAQVIVRGFHKGNLKATVDRIRDLNGIVKGSGVGIDPLRFKMFGIERVPAYVMTTEASTKCIKMPCEPPKHAFALGSVTLEFVLQNFSTSRNEEVKNQAKQFLQNRGNL